MSQNTQEWTCGHCGAKCSRSAVRGQVPKWCSSECRWQAQKARYYVTSSAECGECGKEFSPGDRRTRLCSRMCVAAERARLNPPREIGPKEPRDLRSPMRKAWEEEDWQGVINVIKSSSSRVDDCWIWKGRVTKGYPFIKVGKKYYGAHRLSVSARLQRKMTPGEHAHHACSNALCVNPEHVIPAHAVDNTIEMKARLSFIARIKELEGALSEVDPNNPALGVLPVY